MATRKILLAENELLRKISKPVEKFDEGFSVLVDDMIETTKQNNGEGLAAPQIGVLRRVIIVKDGKKYLPLVNPEIVKRSGEQLNHEGCLSIPDVFKPVKRPYKVMVLAKDRNGKDVKLICEDVLAITLCHEIDHLNGVLFTDIAEEETEGKRRK